MRHGAKDGANALDRQVQGVADARGETENSYVSTTAPIDRDHANAKVGDSLNGDAESNKLVMTNRNLRPKSVTKIYVKSSHSNWKREKHLVVS